MNLPVDDAVIVVRPDFEAIAVSGRNVAENVNFFAFQFSALQFVDKPLEFLSRIGTIEQ